MARIRAPDLRIPRGLAARRCRAWRSGLLALGLALPMAAQPASLQQLLRLPIEQLLRLQVSSSTADRVVALPCCGGRR